MKTISKKKVINILLGVILVIPAFLSIRITITDSGEHNGYITAVQKSGTIWKNYRVYVKTDIQSSQEDVYCVPLSDTQLVDTLRKFSETKTRVSVKYNGYMHIMQSYSNCSGDTLYAVNEIK